MTNTSASTREEVDQVELSKELSNYKNASARKSIWQLINSIVPYLTLWGLMAFLQLSGYSSLFTVMLAVPAGLLLVRIFILFHDCCHGSFFSTRRANRITGILTGFLTFTPFEEWRYLHNKHHATSGNLDKRGAGDVWTMTVSEYQSASRATRLKYRMFRNPVIMFGLGPVFLFLISMRWPTKNSSKKGRRSVMLTNLALALYVFTVGWTLGFVNFLMIQGPILFVAGAAGIWLFYIQHQYEEAYWTENDSWDLQNSALAGSSFYKLPRILQWLTGNIGYHHIHHLRPGIPNYNLPVCNSRIPVLSKIKPITLKSSLKSMRLHLWDEQARRLVGFGAVKRTQMV